MQTSALYPAAQKYSPLYFLSALGAGGLSVTFFMYLMFWVPHKGRPVPVFEDIMAYFSASGMIGQVMVVIAAIGIVVMTILHFRLLFWNIARLSQFKRTEAYQSLKQTNNETQLLAVPLALAMSVNASFVAGLVFVPTLWTYVEYLFPLALIAFSVIGLYAFSLLGQFLARVLGAGGFDKKANGSFAQVLAGFTFAMVGVGAAAPAAMSHTPWIVGTSLALSTFFIATAMLIALIAMFMAFSSMLENGVAPEAAPTLMVVIPLLTVLGIAFLRQDHGLHTTLDSHLAASDTFMMLTLILAVQILFGLLGLLVLKRQNYAGAFLSTQGKRSPGSYALVCPGVALSVMIHFWVNKGLVATGLIAKFGVAYWAFTAPALIFQIAMIVLVFKLHQLHFAKGQMSANPQPAE